MISNLQTSCWNVIRLRSLTLGWLLNTWRDKCYDLTQARRSIWHHRFWKARSTTKKLRSTVQALSCTKCFLDNCLLKTALMRDCFRKYNKLPKAKTYSHIILPTRQSHRQFHNCWPTCFSPILNTASTWKELCWRLRNGRTPKSTRDSISTKEWVLVPFLTSVSSEVWLKCSTSMFWRKSQFMTWTWGSVAGWAASWSIRSKSGWRLLTWFGYEFNQWHYLHGSGWNDFFLIYFICSIILFLSLILNASQYLI